MSLFPHFSNGVWRDSSMIKITDSISAACLSIANFLLNLLNIIKRTIFQ